ncbi:MAG: ATP-binding cassette domain-containing protein [Rhodospirillum sp.]|nr:ATP-binding cassette domain-containing protein [Rhodospirillum sp.]MCF8488166.1 ATP-binding cassette domain-containing protein [Rhodospirillum sp.]
MALILDDLTVLLGGGPLFAPLSLTVEAGEVVTLMGPSGVGKSTLLALLTGTLDRAFTPRGRVTLEGRDLADLPPERRGIGILFQDDMLFPHLTLAENLAFGVPRGEGGGEGGGNRQAARWTKVEAALAEAGLAGQGSRDPATLSGGQRARAALMRTLLSQPRAVLLDEPFSKLDATARARIRAFVLDHVTARGLPTLLVTHDPEDAHGRVVTLDPPSIPPDEY